MSTNNTYFSLAALKASAVSEGTAFLNQDSTVADGVFIWSPADFSGQADEINVVESVNEPLSVGAWLRQGASALTFKRSGPDTVRRSLAQTIEEIEVSLADYGVSPSATPVENLARFKEAISACPVGARLRLPPTAPLTVKLYTNGGASSMPVIDKRLHLIIDGDLEATHSVHGVNASCLLVNTAEGTVVSGSGSFIGDGAIRDTNEPVPEGRFPCLLRNTAANFTCTGVTFAKIPQIGLHLWGGDRAVVDGCKFTGGPVAYGDTAHFGIRAYGCSQLIISGNRFYPDAGSGMQVQGILLSGCSECIISQNVATRPYEKLVYAYGSRNIAIGNTIVGNSGFIPGTNIQGTITSVIRFHGDDNKVNDNLTINCAGGAQMMDGSGAEVADNKFLKCGQGAISIYQGNTSKTRIINNQCTYGELAGFVVGDGIRVVADSSNGNTQPSKSILIEGNTISGFSVSKPLAKVAGWGNGIYYGLNSVVKPTGDGNGRFYVATKAGTSGGTEPDWPSTVWPVPATVVDGGSGGVIWTTFAYEGGQAEIKVEGGGTGKEVAESTILNNNMSGGLLGLVTNHVIESKVSLNKVDALEYALTENNGANNRWEFNDVKGFAFPDIRNLSATSTNLNYAEDSGTLEQGQGLIVTGGFTGEYSYERIGRTIHLRGSLAAGTGVKIPVAGARTQLPVTPAKSATGTVWNTYLTKTGTVMVLPEDNGLYFSQMDDAGVGFSTIVFQISYPALLPEL
jgi:parallel beta-helix repeat protein